MVQVDPEPEPEPTIIQNLMVQVEPEPEPEPTKKEKVTDVRLPTHLVPEKYRLKLVPFIIKDNFTIKGYVEVEICSVIKFLLQNCYSLKNTLRRKKCINI